ncbi:MAG TPA: histidine phosphatase family protein [Brevundimonas sp.]|jgi:phosphohistidine phosphatase|uniref:SixA phosphatase family protein n=1 Tax=Brevundimonas sp. TaxID=1871086 RepID=UPI002DF46B32|nr:histidine phosphatase family protein [Brevundimonas sp.]
MNRLILMRHAKAERDSASGRDVDRPLSARGVTDAGLVARALAQRGVRPDVALVSSAERTRQTWDAAHDAFGDVDVVIEAGLYDASAAALRRAVEAQEDRAGCLAVIAHNPGVHQLAVELLIEGAASPAAIERFATGFPTGAAAVFAVDANGRASLELFLRPRDVGGGADA